LIVDKGGKQPLPVLRSSDRRQEIRAGDTVIIPPNTRHWHGTAPDKLFA